MRGGCDDSLQRLGADHIDIYAHTGVWGGEDRDIFYSLLDGSRSGNGKAQRDA